MYTSEARAGKGCGQGVRAHGHMCMIHGSRRVQASVGGSQCGDGAGCALLTGMHTVRIVDAMRARRV